MTTPPQRAPLGADLLIPGLALGFAIYFFFSIEDLGWEAKSNGVLVGSVLVALIAVQFARIGLKVARGAGNLSFSVLLQPREALVKRILLVVLTVVFIASLQWLGLTLDLLVCMALALYLMGVRKRAQLVLIPSIVAAFAYLMFVAALGSEIPHGPIEKLLAWIF
ncbi:MAG: hypothetical protein WBO23_11550 [Burkholderiales bacterium]